MDQFHKALIELNMDSPEELQSYIQKLSAAVEQAKQKILQAEVSLEVDVVDSKPETPDLEQLEPSLEDVENINDFEPLFSEETPEVEKPVATVQRTISCLLGQKEFELQKLSSSHLSLERSRPA